MYMCVIVLCLTPIKLLVCETSITKLFHPLVRAYLKIKVVIEKHLKTRQ